MEEMQEMESGRIQFDGHYVFGVFLGGARSCTKVKQHPSWFKILVRSIYKTLHRSVSVEVNDNTI